MKINGEEYSVVYPGGRKAMVFARTCTVERFVTEGIPWFIKMRKLPKKLCEEKVITICRVFPFCVETTCVKRRLRFWELRSASFISYIVT